GRDFFLGVFPTSFHSAWKTRRSIRKPSVVERRRVSHSSHSPTATIITYRTSKPRETDRQLVSANPVLYKIHRPDISLATKSGHFNLLRTRGNCLPIQEHQEYAIIAEGSVKDRVCRPSSA